MNKKVHPTCNLLNRTMIWISWSLLFYIWWRNCLGKVKIALFLMKKYYVIHDSCLFTIFSFLMLTLTSWRAALYSSSLKLILKNYDRTIIANCVKSDYFLCKYFSFSFAIFINPSSVEVRSLLLLHKDIISSIILVLHRLKLQLGE